MLILLAATAVAQPPETHVPAPAGWTAVDQEYRYGRDSLWEYINGAAELFLTYRFSELVVADFEQGEAALTVSVYDMGGKLDAYGVYETEKPQQAETLPGVGAAAVLQPPYQGLLIKGRFYVKFESGGGDVTAEVLGAAMKDVAVGLPGDDSLPPELASLPETGRIPGTVAFAGSDFLGFEDLKSCLYADYAGEGGAEYRLFVMTPSAAFLRNDSGKWDCTEVDGKSRFARSIPYRGVVVLLGDQQRLMGVSGPEEVEAATVLLLPLMK